MNYITDDFSELRAEDWTVSRLLEMSPRELQEDYDSILWEQMYYDSIIRSIHASLPYDRDEPEHPTTEYRQARERSKECQKILNRINSALGLKEK